MSILYRTNNTLVTCSDLTSYNKLKHDLYTWNYPDWPIGEPIFANLLQPGLWGGFLPNGYNQNCYIRDSFFIPDFSGKSTRRRVFGINDPSSNGWYTNFGRPSCFPTGSPNSANTQQEELARNIGNWNYGAPTGVLISPRHILVCGHFVGNPSTFTFNFLLKNSTNISVQANRITGSNSGNLLSGDIRIFRLDAANSMETFINQGLITIYNDFIDPTDIQTYNFLNTNYWNSQTIIEARLNSIIGWRVDGAERIVRGVLQYSNTAPNQNPNQPPTSVRLLFGIEPNPLYKISIPLDEYQASHSSIFTGDSGSPKFVFDLNTNKTILIGLDAGGELNHVENTTPNANNLTILTQELNSFGYSINKLNLNNLKLLTYGDLAQQQEQQNQITISPEYYRYNNTFKNITTTPLYRYPYSSRIYQND